MQRSSSNELQLEYAISSKLTGVLLKMPLKRLNRTVQFWRIVDARDNQPLEKDYDWAAIFGDLYGKTSPLLFEADLEGRKFLGQVVTLGDKITELLHHELTDVFGSKGSCQHFGVILAGDKDYVPNQQNKQSGVQQPVGLNEGWDAVDNSFVWHLAFGNMFAILLESQSSGRANRYAAWLTRFLRQSGIISDQQVSYEAIPVIDGDVVDRARKAKGIKAVSLRTSLGRASSANNPVNRIFASHSNYHDVDIEIKITTRPGRSRQEDEQENLEWFRENLGDLTEFSKAVVKTVDSKGTIDELNLLKERLSRKQNITLDTSKSAADAINKDSVFPAIVEAFVKNYRDLQGLKDDGR